jgi:hypothetical protein
MVTIGCVAGDSSSSSRRARGEADDAAFQAWYEMTDEVRAQVAELAADGKAHPDPDIRAAAENWARAVLRKRPWGLLGVAAGFASALIAATIPGDAGLGANVGSASDRNNIYRRREAKRILQAGD